VTKEEKKIIKSNLKSAKMGKKFFSAVVDDSAVKRAFKKNKKLSKAPYTQVILFFEEDDELNMYGMRYLDEYILRNNPYETVVLSCSKFVNDNIHKLVNSKITMYNITFQNAKDIIMFLRLAEFDRMIKIISLEEPLGRNGNNLLYSGKISKELMVAVGIYRLIPFEKI